MNFSFSQDLDKLIDVMQKDIYKENIVPTSITKQTYLDLIEKTFKAYTNEELWSRTKVDGTFFDLHAYSRVTCCLSCLLSEGRLRSNRKLWEHMIVACCKEISSMVQNEAADFAIKEIMLAIKLMKPHISAHLLKQLLSYLALVSPDTHYACVVRSEEDEKHLHNINIYNMIGEFLRETEGLTDTTDYFQHHWPMQLKKFNDYGMYRDPGCPTLYDVTTRMHIKLMLLYGYQGEFAQQLEELMQRGALMTLLTQSIIGELPFGGRTNQFLFNEVLIAVNGEFEANRYHAIGMDKLAGMFKRSAHLAIQSIMNWINMNPPRHIKNGYPIDSLIGTEYYANYYKYLATFGSFLVMGYIVANDDIKEHAISSEKSSLVAVIPDDFHKLIAHAGGYTIQLDLKADSHYDATGFGRLHKQGIPSELALSTPFTGNPSYLIPEHVQRRYVSIAPGWYNATGQLHFLSEYSDEVVYNVHIVEETDLLADFIVNYFIKTEINSEIQLRERYVLSQNGLDYSAEILGHENDIVMQLPLLATNGLASTKRDISAARIEVKLDNFRYTITSDAYVVKQDLEWIANRNGEYERIELYSKNNTFKAHFTLEAL